MLVFLVLVWFFPFFNGRYAVLESFCWFIGFFIDLFIKTFNCKWHLMNVVLVLVYLPLLTAVVVLVVVCGLESVLSFWWWSWKLFGGWTPIILLGYIVDVKLCLVKSQKIFFSFSAIKSYSLYLIQIIIIINLAYLLIFMDHICRANA